MRTLFLMTLAFMAAPCAQAARGQGQPGKDARALLRKGISAYEGARFDDCAELIGRGIEAFPGWKTASGFRAMCRWTAGESKAAQSDARLALSLQPNGPESFAARGFANFVLKRLSSAEEDFRSGIEMDPKYALAHFGLGSVLSQRGKPKDALGALDDAVRLMPDSALFRVVRGTVRDKLKDFRGAVYDYDAVLKSAPSFDWAYYYRGRDRRELKQFAKAAEDLTAFLKRNPDHEDALYLRGNVLFQLGDYRGAVQDLDRVIVLNPRHGLAYANRGVARGQGGERAGAVADLEKARALVPDRAAQIDAQLQRLRSESQEERKSEGPSGVAADALIPGEGLQEPEEGLAPPGGRRGASRARLPAAAGEAEGAAPEAATERARPSPRRPEELSPDSSPDKPVEEAITLQ